MSLPHWARKPSHKKEVVATPRGWMVKETGEYLKLVKDLDEKLKALKVDLDDSLETIEVAQVEPEKVEPEPEVTITNDEALPTTTESDSPSDEVEPKEEEKPKPKRRGRPRKNKSTNSTPYTSE